MKANLYSTDTAETREEAIAAAQNALREKKTIVIPTDTVYGIAADAFSAEAVSELLAAKGRSRTMPPPVLIFDEAVLPGLADEVSDDATALARKFWPGALTLILYSQPSLNWDLGETQGTVALRVPNDPLAIDLLRQTGPLAVSSANKTGQTAATSAQEAAEQLGENVEVIIDGGVRPADRADSMDSAQVLPSTIVDCTSERVVVVREGAISIDEIRTVVPDAVTKSELENENQRATVARGEDRRATGSVAAEKATAVGLGDGPRAASPASGSFHDSLVGSGAPQGAPAVDQMRTKEGHRHQIQKRSDATKPLSQAQAQALLFDDAPNDASTKRSSSPKHLAEED